MQGHCRLFPSTVAAGEVSHGQFHNGPSLSYNLHAAFHGGPSFRVLQIHGTSRVYVMGMVGITSQSINVTYQFWCRSTMYSPFKNVLNLVLLWWHSDIPRPA